MTLVGKISAAAVCGVLTLALTFYWRHFPVRLALISGVAVGVLAFSTLGAGARLTDLYRRRR